MKTNVLYVIAIVCAAMCFRAQSQPCPLQWISSPEQGILGCSAGYLVPWDPDGPGPRPTSLAVVYNTLNAEATRANSIMLWDGAQWSPAPGDPAFPPDVFGGCSRAVSWHSDLTSTDYIFASGEYRNGANTTRSYLYAYDRVQWRLPGGAAPNSDVYDMVAFDPDGPGPEPSLLVCCGRFTKVGDTAISHVASFDGINWTQLGAAPPEIGRLAVVDFDGPGPLPPTLFGLDLYGGQIGPPLHVYENGTWKVLQKTCVGRVNSISTLFRESPQGPTQELALAGAFTMLDGTPCKNAARWNGTSVFALGDDLLAPIARLVSAPASASNPNPSLYALATGITSDYAITHAPIVFAWDGQHWLPIGDSARTETGDTSAWDGCVVNFSSAQGDVQRLFVIGYIESLNGVAGHRILQWDGSNWAALGNGSSGGPGLIRWRGSPGANGAARLIASAPAVLGGVTIPDRIAEWDGLRWTPIPGCPLKVVRALGTFDPDGPGPQTEWLLVAGADDYSAKSDRVVRWNGIEWTELASDSLPTPDGTAHVYCFASVAPSTPSGSPSLYLGGAFASSSNAPERCVALWNNGVWQRVGSVLAVSSSPATVYGMTAFDFDGSGPNPEKLVITGTFSSPRRVAVLEGDKFVVLGPNGAAIDGRAFATVTSDTGNTPDFYVGGRGGNSAAGSVFRWNGSALVQVGSANAPVLGMTAFAPDPGNPSKQQLFVVGQFTTINNVSANRIARFDGSAWSAIDAGLNDSATSIQPFGSSPLSNIPAELVIGGAFFEAGPFISRGWARLSTVDVPWKIDLETQIDARCGEDVTISASVVPGYASSAQYQWHHLGTPLSDGLQSSGTMVRGAATPTLVLQSARRSDAGEYTLRVRGNCTDTVSSVSTTLALTQCCPGDFNHDSVVDDTDFEVFAAQYDIMVCDPQPDHDNCAADLNHDLLVNDADFAIFVVAYHQCTCAL